MRLRQCEYFDAIVRSGTIRGASKELLVSEPTISTQIKELERELKVSLFIRRGRRLELSHDGRLLAPLLRRVVSSAVMAAVTANELHHPAGPLRIGVIPSYAPVLVPRLVSLCADHYPDVSLDVVESGSLALEQNVLEGIIDLAVLTRCAGISHDDPELSVRPVAHASLVAVMSGAHPLADRQTLVAADLIGEQLLLYRPGYLVRELVLRLLGADSLAQVLYSSDNTQTTRSFIGQGIGIGFAIVAETEFIPEDREAGLVRVSITDAPALQLCCAYSTGRYLPRLLSETVAQLIGARSTR